MQLWCNRVYRENDKCYFKATGPTVNTEATQRFFHTWEAKVSGPSTMYLFSRPLF